MFRFPRSAQGSNTSSTTRSDRWRRNTFFDRRLAVLFEDLREARVKADYYVDDCTQDDARMYVRNAGLIVESLLGVGCCDDQ
jgi:hypothetical protein